MEERKHKGSALNIIGEMYEAAMASCLKAIADNPDLVIMYDLESGFPYTATKEERDAYLKMWDDLLPKFSQSNIGKKIIMFGTGGKEKGNLLFNEMFYERRKKNN